MLGKTFYLSSRYHACNSSDENYSEKPTKVYVCSPLSFWYHTSILKIKFHLKCNSQSGLSAFHIFMIKCKKANVYMGGRGSVQMPLKKTAAGISGFQIQLYG